MDLKDIKKDINKEQYNILKDESITKLRPSQEKAIKAGLLKNKNLLICTPTASGKTLIAELAMINNLKKGKSIYVVPLKALAMEKYKDFNNKYNKLAEIAISIGDLDSSEPRLNNKDIILCTAEKLDSLLRHNIPWVRDIKTIIIDEIHLINDPSRGPTLEIILTMLKKVTKAQIIGLSATIGNPEKLAEWLEAELVQDNWRPVELKKGVFLDNKIDFV